MRRLPLMGVLGLMVCMFGFCTQSRAALIDIDWVIQSGSIQLNLGTAVNPADITIPEVTGQQPGLFIPAGGLTFSIDWTSGTQSTIVDTGTLSSKCDAASNTLSFQPGTHSIFSTNPQIMGAVFGSGGGIVQLISQNPFTIPNQEFASFNFSDFEFDFGGDFQFNPDLTSPSPSPGVNNVFGSSADVTSEFFSTNGENPFIGPDYIIPPLASGSTQPVATALGANDGLMIIDDAGGFDRQLTLAIDVPYSIELGDLTFTGTMTGTIVALGTVPEPASASLLAVALCMTGFRRRSRC